MNLLSFLDLAGTAVFAISGFLTAGEKRFDLFGAAVIAFVTAVGGGTLRDLLIGSVPVGWMQNLWYPGMIALGILLAWQLGRWIRKWQRTMFLFDTIGIGIFTILGLEKTLSFGLSPWIAVMMGVVSAVFGGVVRDVLVNREPLVFRQELYATACLLGALLYVGLCQLPLPSSLVILVSVAFIVVVRLLAVLKGWYLPRVHGPADPE